MKIYNTATRQKEEFKPVSPPGVLMYNCGPTVYDYFHIGNARNFVLADTVRRYLEYRGFKVRFVQNLTDIDDKIIKRAAEEGIEAREVAEKYTRIFFDQCKSLGIKRADLHPKATETIPEMIRLIEDLIEKKHAYVVEGDVYFNVRSFPSYGKLSGKNVDDLREGARVDVDDRKKDPIDFALWKAAKPGEPSWDSPWGKGRPGWHIECSAMAITHLGKTIDIHSGGSDLVFPHHENERAQSEAATGQTFVKYWVHNGFLNIDSEKMSKSLGNFFTINQILDRFDPLTVKFFLLSAHYRHPLDFNEENMQSARNASRRILDAISTMQKILELENVDAEEKDAHTEAKEKCIMARRTFEDAMDDDFNAARALGVLHDIVTSMHESRNALEGCPDAESKKPHIAAIRINLSLLLELLEVLGLDPALGKAETAGEDQLAEDLMRILIDIRNSARAKKDFETADMIRNRLDETDIILEDHPQGTIWRRKH